MGMQSETVVSQRRACQLVGLARSTLRYEPRCSLADEQLQARIIELAQEQRRFGYRRIHALLRREGYEINHKRTYRLYREASLAVRKRKRRKGVAAPREPLFLPIERNAVWSMYSAAHVRCVSSEIGGVWSERLLGYSGLGGKGFLFVIHSLINKKTVRMACYIDRNVIK
jgi:transposase InsO family protein